ncbi:Predicted nucleotidyltransferase [Peptoclostridium litorale DSM 5388]|uniref:tRNA(Met) cytidine acetate ligase n=1 Tax=Peptoclostridium litorale DSM 5388 TaxID=1121324 RepID=A0A069RDA3_PEPLI|nr:nucleotidyltransferase [Peptoclostridium litorale]KDR95044.1 hypothetical protein UPF0348 [Peptoclostridium litorale DSM 5388]SIN75953.1 Predicted nucleotidyltransferase [Peptoclostridium litorale DSM 5388]
MKILGLVTEYNPFHNGHLYHLEESKKISGATHTVAVMSGHFLQRGEPALFDKWTRAEMAVRSGVDLVVELPLVFSSQTAEIFAYGAVSVLDSMCCMDSLCFGSESGNIENLKLISSILADEPFQFQCLLKENLSSGMSFPSARENALIDYISQSPNMHLEKDELESISKDIKNPNNILGVEYIKSLIHIGSSIHPHTIKRISAEYNSTQIIGEICSATAIREHLKSSYSMDELENVMPEYSFRLLERQISKGFLPVFDHMFFEMILCSIISKDAAGLCLVNEVKEGIQNAVSKYVRSCKDFEDLTSSLKSKRYTMTSIKRMLSNILLDIKREDIDYFKNLHPSPYARILAFNEKGTQILKKVKQNSGIQVINKTANASFSAHMHQKMLDYDIKSTDIYNIVYYRGRRDFMDGSADYKTSPVFVRG